MAPEKIRYSQFTAFRALLTAALKSMLKSPTAVIFSFAFPLVFILAFSFMDPNTARVYKIAVTDTSSPELQEALQANANIQLLSFPRADSAALHHLFKVQELEALIDLQGDAVHPRITIVKTTLDPGQSNLFYALLQQSLTQRPFGLEEAPAARITALRRIDFILPGQLGFALLAASVFGTAFLFYNLRQNLVLKRFLATPVKPVIIIVAECVARIIIQVISTAVILLIGYYWLDYTLINRFATFADILVISTFSLFTFLSYGFIISGIARSEAMIPPLANIVTLPQFILAGTFFPVESLPKWLQWLANIMPLTYYNHAVRSVAFEGAGLWAIKSDLAILALWGVLSLFIALRTFKWE